MLIKKFAVKALLGSLILASGLSQAADQIKDQDRTRLQDPTKDQTKDQTRLQEPDKDQTKDRTHIQAPIKDQTQDRTRLHTPTKR